MIQMWHTSHANLSIFMDIPIDIIDEIAGYLQPVDLLHLARTCKSLRATFMSRSSRHVWVEARKGLNMPDANAVAISEPAYASLVFERICSLCSKVTSSQTRYSLQLRLCDDCDREHLKAGSQLLVPYQHLGLDVHRVLQLLPPPFLSLHFDVEGQESLSLNNGYYEYLASDFEATMKKYLLLHDDQPALEQYMMEKQRISYQATIWGWELFAWERRYRNAAPPNPSIWNRKTATDALKKISVWLLIN